LLGHGSGWVPQPAVHHPIPIPTPIPKRPCSPWGRWQTARPYNSGDKKAFLGAESEGEHFWGPTIYNWLPASCLESPLVACVADAARSIFLYVSLSVGWHQQNTTTVFWKVDFKGMILADLLSAGIFNI